MPETPNHGYNVPNEGEQDWHIPLNENFEQYDTDIEVRDRFDNRDNYEPKQGAKFFATDSGAVFIGDGSEWLPVRSTGRAPTFGGEVTITGSLNMEDAIGGLSGNTAEFKGLGVRRSPSRPLEVGSSNNWNLDNSDGDVRIGGEDHRLAIGISLDGAGAGTSRLRAKGGTEQLKLGAGSSDTVNVKESSVTVNGDLDVSGNKNFTQSVDTDDGEKEVVYTATEAATPHTEASGVAELEDGRAAVDLPEHFGWVTDDDEPLHVQTTPYAADSGGLAVVERSTDRIVVEDLDGEGGYEFAYTVKGTRDGHADKEVVREPTAEGAGESAAAPADD